MKGCSCQKGCKTKQCGCRKNCSDCGPGCNCKGCTNLPVATQIEDDEVIQMNWKEPTGVALRMKMIMCTEWNSYRSIRRPFSRTTRYPL